MDKRTISVVIMILTMGKTWSAMVCHKQNSGHLFKLPEFTCSTDEPTVGRIKIYKRNIRAYTVDAQSLSAEVKICTTKQYFFGSKTAEKKRRSLRWTEAVFKEHILGHTCQDMNGQMTRGADMSNPFQCRYTWPSENTVETVTCHHRNGYVSATHAGHVISDLGLMNHCQYNSGFCLTRDNTAITWLPYCLIWQKLSWSVVSFYTMRDL